MQHYDLLDFFARDDKVKFYDKTFNETDCLIVCFGQSGPTFDPKKVDLVCISCGSSADIVS